MRRKLQPVTDGLPDGREVPGVRGAHLRPGDGGCLQALLPRRGHQLHSDGLQSASLGELRQSVEGLQARQQGAGLVHREADRAVDFEILRDEDVVVLPLDVQEIVRVALGKAGTDQNPQIVFQFLPA